MKARIGCDLVSIERFEVSLKNPAFLQKVFHPIEIEYAQARVTSVESLAARFAAKEAFGKALGLGLYGGGLSPTQVWVENLESGKPVLKWSDTVQNILNAEDLKHCDVSLSHHGVYAMATVILMGH